MRHRNTRHCGCLFCLDRKLESGDLSESPETESSLLCVLGGNSPPQPRGQHFSLRTGKADGVYFHCVTTGASPAHHLRLQNGRRAEKRMCLESEHGYLGVLTFLTLCPLPTCSPSATSSRFPTAISVHTRASFPGLDPTPPPAFPPTVPVPLPPFQCSAGSVEGPHTDLEEARPRIRSPGTGADETQPRGQRAGTRTGAYICARADHVNAAAQEFHRPTPRLLASRFQPPTTSLQQGSEAISS
ncbi:uncharacterized protein LOC129053009 isoform X2 [Pongo abelii]|uniref:uncharacterized protein LOC129053009 isoform X2 n=1 Tax=Pongo abelii TaxID=9601 RepID=UPI0030078ACB